MAIEFSCGTCDSVLSVSDEHAGKQAKCPKCANVNSIPNSSQPAPAPPVVPPPVAPQAMPAGYNAGYSQPMQGMATQAPYGAPISGSFEPHRGGLVLTMGIFGVVFSCLGIIGIIGIVMSSRDLKKIKAGQMDPQGEGLTTFGLVLSIVGTVIFACVLLYVLFILAIVALATAAGP